MWEEYVTEVGGSKSAKLFTEQERGTVKLIYCRRLPFWLKISGMVRVGWNATDAINAVCNSAFMVQTYHL